MLAFIRRPTRRLTHAASELSFLSELVNLSTILIVFQSGVPTFHPPVSTVTSVHDPSKEQGGGGGPTQAGSKPPLLTHYAPHHSMFYSGQSECFVLL